MLASCRSLALRFSTQSPMARANKLLDQILRGGADANIPFSGMVQLLKRLGFQERIKGSHHIFFRDGVAEILNYWSQADEAFIAEVPELPGCAADGKTYKDALASVEIIIQEWIETARVLGRPIPAPRGRLAFA